MHIWVALLQKGVNMKDLQHFAAKAGQFLGGGWIISGWLDLVARPLQPTEPKDLGLQVQVNIRTEIILPCITLQLHWHLPEDFQNLVPSGHKVVALSIRLGFRGGEFSSGLVNTFCAKNTTDKKKFSRNYFPITDAEFRIFRIN